MYRHEDVCSHKLLNNELKSLHHNQTIYYLTDDTYCAFLKCFILDAPQHGVDYYNEGEPFRTLGIVCSRVDDRDNFEIIYLKSQPETLEDIVVTLTRLLILKAIDIRE